MKLRVTALLAGSLVGASAQSSPPEEWHFKDWPEAVAQAKAESKPLFVLFGFEDCPWCRYLYQHGMSDRDLRATYQRRVILAYFDTKMHGREEQLVFPGGTSTSAGEIIERLHAYPTPSWVFISPCGVVLNADRGSMTTPIELRRALEVALSKPIAPRAR